jgi:hypothetical protein
MKRTVATVIASAALAVPAQAAAAPIMGAPLPAAKSAQSDTSTTSTTPTTTTTTTTPFKLTQNELADRRALNAYAAYLTTLLAQQTETAGETNDSSFTATISSTCKAALEPLTQPPDEVNASVQHTLTVLGEEMGDDLSINFDLAATPAFTKFTDVLTHLHWKLFSGAELVVKRYVNKESAVLALSSSNLCLDASDAQLKPAVVPDGTKLFIKTYDDASGQANLGLTGLMTLMQSYEIPSEKALVARIATLAGELMTQSRSDLLQSGTSLSAVLESN